MKHVSEVMAEYLGHLETLACSEADTTEQERRADLVARGIL
jgi:hypothetical protein